jgi:hypothetical protein
MLITPKEKLEVLVHFSEIVMYFSVAFAGYGVARSRIIVLKSEQVPEPQSNMMQHQNKINFKIVIHFK